MVKKFAKLKFKRRRERKTDYKARLLLLKSGLPRLVIRKTNKYIIAQIIKSKNAQDFVLLGVNSKELSAFGWAFSFKNIPAAYITGLILGNKANKKEIKKVILDLGITRSTKGSKSYAVVKGAIDSGIEVPCDEKMFPGEKRLLGEHTKNAEKIKNIINKIKSQKNQK